MFFEFFSSHPICCHFKYDLVEISVIAGLFTVEYYVQFLKQERNTFAKCM